MNFNVKNNYFILGVFLCFSLTSYAQNDSTIIRRNFVGKNLSELDKITTETVENIITFFNRKKKPFGYKIGTNKHEKIIKKQTVPNDYIITKPIIRINQADFRNFEIEKNINPKLELVVTYPRITPSKGYVSFQVGDFTYKRYLKDIKLDNIDYIKLISTSDSNGCIVQKYRLLPKKDLTRHFSFVLDHSGSMGDDRASKLQLGVYNAISNNFKKDKNKDTYSIHKFDGEGNIQHLITSKKLDEIRDVLLPTTGLLGFGHSTAIKDALFQAVDVLSKDNYSDSKIIILFTDGFTNTDANPLSLSDVIRLAIDNNINIAPVGFGNYFDRNYLEGIRYFSGGKLYEIYHEDEFNQLFDNIITDIESSYKIEFSPCMFGEQIQIEIKIKGLEEPLVGNTFFSTPIKSGYSIDLNLLFENGSSIIDNKKYANDLRQVIQIMMYKPSIQILIEGHTDKVGREKYNIDLSLKRAKSIKKYFVDQGIAENRIETNGLGWSVPAYSYMGSEKGNALNRRIEIKIK
jgi:outer membrane protein OmpA-like peptidoglycan-associated protein|tara:strand:+ start:401 stop:1951 length:1551 start_codon:yes stop_codon:yes gene_type:complete